MTRCRIAVVALVALAGCGAPAIQTQTQTPSWGPTAQELRQAQDRLGLQLEEVTRNLMALRARLDAQEAVVRALGPSREEPPGARQPLRVVKLDPAPVETPVSSETGGAAAGSPAADLYRKAFNAYRAGRFGQAILDFEDFLRRFGRHEYADNAQYWIGESYYSQGEYEQALVEFQRVIDRYPQESKAPDALLKIGLAYEKMGDPAKARVFWRRTADQYPDTESAREARKMLDAR